METRIHFSGSVLCRKHTDSAYDYQENCAQRVMSEMQFNVMYKHVSYVEGKGENEM